MSYREKFAWLSLLAMALSFGAYFAYVIFTQQPQTAPSMDLLGLYCLTTLAYLALVGVGGRVLRLRTPEDDRGPPDERDIGISRQSYAIGYGILLVGMILIGVVLPLTGGGWHVVNATLLAIVIAQTLRYGVTIWGYRRAS